MGKPKSIVDNAARLSLVGIYLALILIFAFFLDYLIHNLMISFSISVFIISTIFYWIRYQDIGRGILIFHVFLGIVALVITFNIVLSIFIVSLVLFLLVAYKTMSF